MSVEVGTGRLQTALCAARERGRKLLVPYLTGGASRDWPALIGEFAAAGADAIEVGIPFSDPIMDGPIIQQASALALQHGTTPDSILAALRGDGHPVPLAAMTYYNIVFRAGHERFASSLVRSGVSAAIVPDLPLEESGPWESAATAAGIETVLLAAPVTPDDRLEEICRRARGFVYGVGLMGVTGERDSVALSAALLARRLKAVTDKPVLIGLGVSTPDQARAVCADADGVIVGSALVRRVLEGQRPEQVGEAVAAMRAALDAG